MPNKLASECCSAAVMYCTVVGATFSFCFCSPVFWCIYYFAFLYFRSCIFVKFHINPSHLFFMSELWTPHEAHFFTKWEHFDKSIKPFDVKVSKQHLKVFIHRSQSWTDLLACFKIYEKALILLFVETQNKQSWDNKGGRKQVAMQLRITNIVIWGSNRTGN